MVPGGKLFIVCGTPYLKLAQSFRKEYLRRKTNGVKWPGIVDNFPEFLGGNKGKHVPNLMHFFDTDIMRRSLLEAGFIVEECSYFSRDNIPDDWKDDGREALQAIATKPQ